jgi:hypothetical protein
VEVERNGLSGDDIPDVEESEEDLAEDEEEALPDDDI